MVNKVTSSEKLWELYFTVVGEILPPQSSEIIFIVSYMINSIPSVDELKDPISIPEDAKDIKIYWK